MRDLFVTLVVFGALPFVLMRPHIGIYLWSWISYMNPHRLTWGFAYHMPFAQIAGLALIAGFLFSNEKKHIPWNYVTIPWALFVVWICITTPFALAPDVAVPEWIRAIKIQVVTLLTLMLINDKNKLQVFVAVLTFSIGFFGIKGGVFVVATGGSYRVWGPAGSFIEGNNELALALILVLPLMYYFFMQYSNKWLRMFLLASIFLMVFSVLGSYSRGAFLAISSILGVLWLRSRYKIVIGVGLSLVIAIGLFFMPQQWKDRMFSISEYEEDGSAMGRINAWWTSFYVATDRIVTGGGFNVLQKSSTYQKYAPNPEDTHDAHSIYFEVLGEHGFIGLILFLLIWAFSLHSAGWVRRRTKDLEDLRWAYNLATMAQLSIVGYAVGGAFLGLAYFDLPYHIMCIIVITRLLVEKELSQKKQEEQALQPTRPQYY